MNRTATIRFFLTILALCCMTLGFMSIASAKANKVDVIMVYDAKPGKAEKNRVKGLGGETKREFKNFNMRVISVSENALKNLGKGKGVKFVAVDRPIESFSTAALQTAGQPDAGSVNSFSVNPNLGIAVMDSGVSTHGDLNVASRVNCTAAATSEIFADSFATVSYSNNDGSSGFGSAWAEYDVAGAGPNSGNVTRKLD